MNAGHCAPQRPFPAFLPVAICSLFQSHAADGARNPHTDRKDIVNIIPHRSGDNAHALFRPDAYVVLRILRALWDAGGESGWTALMYASKLNPGIFSTYIGGMQKKGLIVVKLDRRSRKIVRITKFGVQALDDIQKYF